MADSTYNDSGGTGYPQDGSYHAASAGTVSIGPDMLPDADPRLTGNGSSWGSGERAR